MIQGKSIHVNLDHIRTPTPSVSAQNQSISKLFNKTPEKELAHRRFHQDTKLKWYYGRVVIPVLIFSWLFAVLWVLTYGVYHVVYVQGVETLYTMPESVQAILAGSTTVNLVGLMYVVVKHLFQNGDLVKDKDN